MACWTEDADAALQAEATTRSRQALAAAEAAPEPDPAGAFQRHPGRPRGPEPVRAKPARSDVGLAPERRGHPRHGGGAVRSQESGVRRAAPHPRALSPARGRGRDALTTTGVQWAGGDGRRKRRRYEGCGSGAGSGPTPIWWRSLLIVAGGVRRSRSAFAFRVPAFVTKDSIEYVEPALIAGGRRAVRAGPAAHAGLSRSCMAGSVALFGRDLLAITFAQHLLGVGTAIFTFGIGRLTFGRAAGLLAGLGAALSSPLLIYEHYLITEPVFTFFLILSILLLVAGLRTETAGVLALGGLALGLAALTGRSGQAVLVALPFAALVVSFRRWRPSIMACVVAGGCFALLVVPWAIRNQVVYGTAARGQHGPVSDLALGQARAQLRVL